MLRPKKYGIFIGSKCVKKRIILNAFIECFRLQNTFILFFGHLDQKNIAYFFGLKYRKKESHEFFFLEV